jgi:hypothetical protein
MNWPDALLKTGTPAMPLQEGGTYRVPDGRVFKAAREIRRYAPGGNAWTLVPLDIDKSAGHAWRESLGRLLFLEDDRIFYFDFAQGVQVRDTGWAMSDLKLET